MTRSTTLLVVIFLSSCFAPEHVARQCGAAETVTVMSFNIWRDGKSGKQPLSQTAKVIEESGADVVGLQEVDENAGAIAKLLGWNHLQHGGDTAVLSRYKILGKTDGGHGVRFQLAPGVEAIIFNVHFDHAPYQPYQLLGIPYAEAPFVHSEKEAIAAATAARGHEVRALLDDVATVKNSGAPMFVTGDFNEPSHLDWTVRAAESGVHPMKVVYPTTAIIAAAGFHDAYRAVHKDELDKPGYTWTPLTTADDPKDHHDRIDFVMFRGEGVSAEKVAVVGEHEGHADIVVSPFPSDHRAVAATFSIDLEAGPVEGSESGAGQ